ncbi:hypothetical protein EGN69_16385 [Pseudomonas monteilii]|jgi:hypothetical protein|nr:hypothetical protein BGP83_15825 [Pseudomonas putida]POF96315.1 hypothetical protein BGP81_06065 [Pseudomonas putida]RPD91996.1 hypothetical protein EGN69_16385 [Pseudomonas monteilii]
MSALHSASTGCYWQKYQFWGWEIANAKTKKTPESLELPGPVPLAIDKQLLPALAQFNKRA